MLQHTLERAARIAKPEQVVTVVAREHAGYWSHQIGGAFARGAVTQPVNRDTAAGIFLPLARVRASNPEATVAVFPSDHFVHPRGRFLETSLKRLAESGADRGDAREVGKKSGAAGERRSLTIEGERRRILTNRRPERRRTRGGSQ